MATEAEIAWAAGIIEGEGNIGRNGRNENQRAVRVGMTDRDVIESLHRIFECGYVHRNPVINEKFRVMWRWEVYAASDVREVLTLILPWLHSRRRAKALDALAALRKNGGALKLRTHCPKGHPYDEVNTYHRPDRTGRQCRVCRECQRIKNREAKRRKRAEKSL